MDPNETLRRMLALVEYMHSHVIQFSAESLELADCVSDLNTWILRGGFLPGRWEVAQKRARET